MTPRRRCAPRTRWARRRDQGLRARRRKGRRDLRHARRAERAIRPMLDGQRFGDAGNEILVEEFMEGEELSLFVAHRRHERRPMLPAQDHKRLLAGDDRARTPAAWARTRRVASATTALSTGDRARSSAPRCARCATRARRSRGLLYAGLMVDARRRAARRRVQLPLRRSGDTGHPPAAREPLLPRLLGVALGRGWTKRRCGGPDATP